MENNELKDKKLSRRGSERFKNNPFTEKAAVNAKDGIKHIKDGEKVLVINPNIEDVAINGFTDIQEVSEAHFLRLYIAGIKAFKGLSNAATKVFEVVYTKVHENSQKDFLHIHFMDINQDITVISMATYMRGMSELVEKGFLAESAAQGKYFINPDYIFSNDRLRFVREYVVV